MAEMSIPRPMAVASEPNSSSTPTFLPTRDVHERIADADRDADQAPELGVDAGELGRAAGQDDLADAQGAGLVLVELERRDELAGECVELPLERRHAPSDACSVVRPAGVTGSTSESACLIATTSDGAMSSARAIATPSFEPPQSSTRVNSQCRPSETPKVERSWPTLTTTVAARAARRRRAAP